MRTLAHLSDLHFGRLDRDLLTPLAKFILNLRPDVIAVSGDLTQRARRREFRQARNFLQTLPFPKVIVPGNHDVPLYNVVFRSLRPLKNYRRYIDQDLQPFFQDSEIAVSGINTARSLAFKGGRINRRQVAEACARFQAQPPQVTRIVVTHHPFDKPGIGDSKGIVGRAAMAIEGFANCRVDMFLSGHLHFSQISPTATRYRIANYSALVVQAGTATSTRRRGEANAFNVIHIEQPSAQIESFCWDSARATFVPSRKDTFRRGPRGWEPAEAASRHT